MIGCDLWSDDPALRPATAGTGVTGMCGSGIIEIPAEMYLAGIIRHDGVIDGELAARNPRIQRTAAPSATRSAPAPACTLRCA